MLRRLLARLPEPESWALWVRFVIIQTGNCRTFMQQCVQNSINCRESSCKRRSKSDTGSSSNCQSKQVPDCSAQSALARVRGWSRFAYAHLIIITALYLYDLIKYRLLALLDGDHDYVDCFIPGRFRFVGRTNKISGEIVSTFLFWFLVYRWTIHLYVPKFKFFPLEFIMSKRQEIEANEPKLQIVGHNNANKSIHSRFEFRKQRTNASHQAESVALINSIYYLKSPFDTQANRWILRPNRTYKSWLALNLVTKFIFYYSLILLVQWFSFLYWALGGSVLTNLGFEMSYAACVAWLRARQSSSPIDLPGVSNYSHIYLAPKVLAHEIAIDDIPARIPLDYSDFSNATLYTLVRTTMDVLENHLFYLEYVLLFIAQFYVLVILSMDIILNSRAIKRRLVRLLEKMEARGQMGALQEAAVRARIFSHERITNKRIKNYTNLPSFDCQRLALNVDDRDHIQDSNQFREQIVDLQAILADHFDNLTRGYNRYIAFSVYFLGICWFSYTLVICAWMSSVRSRAVEWEFLVAELGATLISLSLMSGIALVRSQNFQLYPLIARAMALDPDWAETKPNWTIILKYFYPRPFYCFAIFDSTELSFLLCIKLLSWIISAFVILANFFYMNKN